MKRFSVLVVFIAIAMLTLSAVSFAEVLATFTTSGPGTITPFDLTIPTGVRTWTNIPNSSTSLLAVGTPLVALFNGNAQITFQGSDAATNGITTATTLIPGGQQTGFSAYSTISSAYAASIVGTIFQP